MRSRTKLKYSQNRQQRNRTGGGPPQEETFTKVEEDILQIIKKVSVDGHENVRESVVEFNLPSTSSHVASTSSDSHHGKLKIQRYIDFITKYKYLTDMMFCLSRYAGIAKGRSFKPWGTNRNSNW